MFNVVLFEPEIPPNTGNIIRLAANTGVNLHLVEPLGFVLDDKGLIRAGLDYHDLARVTVHSDWDTCRRILAGKRIFALTTKGTQHYSTVTFQAGDVFLFGSETSGLPKKVLESFVPEQHLRIPMLLTNRSMNLSNSVAVVVFEAWRQHGFSGAL